MDPNGAPGVARRPHFDLHGFGVAQLPGDRNLGVPRPNTLLHLSRLADPYRYRIFRLGCVLRIASTPTSAATGRGCCERRISRSVASLSGQLRSYSAARIGRPGTADTAGSSDAAMMPNPDPALNPAPNFDRLARPYRWLEYLSFGPFLWRCRVRFLPKLGNRLHALLLGDGDGRFTAELLRTNAQITVHGVDLSPTMIQTMVRSAKAHSGRLCAEVADLRVWSPDPASGFDLIVSHFFLDCLTSSEVAALAQRITSSSAPGALWVVSDFAVPRTRFGALVAKPVVSGLYLAFRWLTGLRIQALPDHEEGLTAAGWSLKSEWNWLNGMLLSQLWERPALRSGGPSELQ